MAATIGRHASVPVLLPSSQTFMCTAHTGEAEHGLRTGCHDADVGESRLASPLTMHLSGCTCAAAQLHAAVTAISPDDVGVDPQQAHVLIC